MYIKKVIIKNIRCFDKFVIKFDKRQCSCLIIGDNGEGKSTLLRSIAMGLCDESSAAALFRELKGKYIRQRKSDKESYFEIHLQDISDRTYITRTEFKSLGGKRLERLKQKVWVKKGKGEKEKIEQDNFPWHRIFVAGYGAGARTLGSGTVDSYLTVDAVYSLFRYDEPLQNPELALRRIKDESSKKKKEKMFGDLLIILRNLLNLGKDDKVYLTKKGIEVRGPWGRCELEALGDGYRSTITWILDMIGRRILHRPTLIPKKMSGIVLIDEVEQHLHPKWQINIMNLIRKAFPRLQVIATTHSPLVVSGCKDCKIRKAISEYDEPKNPYGWLAEDVYREFLDLTADSRSPTFKEEVLGEFERLHRKTLLGKLSPEETDKLIELKKRLSTLPESDPVSLTIEIKNITNSLLQLSKDGE